MCNPFHAPSVSPGPSPHANDSTPPEKSPSPQPPTLVPKDYDPQMLQGSGLEYVGVVAVF